VCELVFKAWQAEFGWEADGGGFKLSELTGVRGSKITGDSVTRSVWMQN
jgi:hypothetical protein